MTAEIGLFDSTRLNYLNFLVEENETSGQSAIQPRSDYELIKICFLVPAGSNPTGSYPNWIVQLGYQYIPTSEWKPLAAWESLIGITITEDQFNELVDFYADHGVGGSPSSYSGPQYQIVCHYYWVPVGGDPYDYIFSGNGFPGNSGPPGSGTGSPNAPVVDLDTYLRRIEACGGLGDPYDYGQSNPTGEHPDRVFCEQLQDLYDCLPFLASDPSLIAWYLWYDSNFPGDTWESLYQFGCSSHMSPIQKEEGIRLFKKHSSPGSAYPPFNNDWEVFLDAWKEVVAFMSQGIRLTADEREWLLLNDSERLDLKVFVDSYFPYNEELSQLNQAISMTLFREMNPIIYSEEEIYELERPTDPVSSAYWVMAITSEYMALKLEYCNVAHNPVSGQVTFSNCEYSSFSFALMATWSVIAEDLHTLLDLGGLAPGIGEIADLANGIIYTIEGDGFNASLSFAGLLPVGGWAATGSRLATRVFKGPSGHNITFKYFRESAEAVIQFGNRQQLRRVLGLTKFNPNIAHHILPWALREHDVIQKAAKSADATLPDGTILKPWHMNDPLNGIPLNPEIHDGGHSDYINKVRSYLNNLKIENPDLSNENALKELKVLADYIRSWINNNPGIHIDNIVLP